MLLSGLFVLVQGARDATRAGVVLGVGWCLAVLILMRSATLIAPIYSGIDLAAALPAAERDAPLYSVRTYDQSLAFYLQRPSCWSGIVASLITVWARLPIARSAEDEFLTMWNSQSKAYAVMDKRTFSTFKERGIPMRTVGQTVGRVLVARQ